MIQNGGTFVFDSDEIIILTNTLTIQSNSTIDAQGHQVTFSGGGKVRAFWVNTNASLTLKGLTITDCKFIGENGNTNGGGLDGKPGYGGAIYVDGGILILDTCKLLNNSAIGGDGADDHPFEYAPPHGNGGLAAGGAIYNAKGSLIFTNSAFSQNAALGGRAYANLTGAVSPYVSGSEGNAIGGAICSFGGNIKIVGGEFLTNSATGASFGGSSDSMSITGETGTGAGGAIYLEQAVSELSNTHFQANWAQGGRNGFFNSVAAGMAAGGALHLKGGVSDLRLCRFEANFCSGGDGSRHTAAGAALGGALYNAAALMTAQCTFTGNWASAGNAGIDGVPAQGGAICNASNLALIASSCISNLVKGADGFVVEVSSYPGGNGFGGALYNSGQLNCTNTTWFGNNALGGARLYNTGFGRYVGANGTGMGGAIYNQGVALLNHATFSSNSAEPGFDQTGQGSTPLTFGGNIYASTNQTTLQNSIITNAKLGKNCFGPIADDGNNICSDSSLQIKATGSLGNTDPMLSDLGTYGGATPVLALLPGSPATDRALPQFCPATDQRGLARPAGNGCDIGAFEAHAFASDQFWLSVVVQGRGTVTASPKADFYTNGAPVTVSAVSANGWRFAGWNGDLTGSSNSIAITMNTNKSVVAIFELISQDENQFRDAIASGGAIQFGADTKIVLTKTIEITNEVTLDGQDHLITISGGNSLRLFNIKGNGSFTASHITFADGWQQTSSISGDAGGFYVYELGNLTLNSCVLSNNNVTGSGGGLLNYGNTHLKDCLFVRNSSGQWGGAISQASGTLDILDSTFQENTSASDAGGQGGSIFQNGGTLAITNTIFRGNIAEANGGAICTFGSASIDRSQFLLNQAWPQHSARQAWGGALAILGTTQISVSNSRFHGNRAQGTTINLFGRGSGSGGAIYNLNGILALNSDSFDANEAEGLSVSAPGQYGGDGRGGAILNAARMFMTNCTVAFNHALGGASTTSLAGTAVGGGICNSSDSVLFDPESTLVNCTISSNLILSENSAVQNLTRGGANIAVLWGPFSLFNSIIADGIGGTNVLGSIIDLGNNICSDSSAKLTNSGSLNSSDPRLSPLADNGGPTLTMALFPESPALDAGSPNGAPKVDQRGAPRPQGGGVDIGAYEAASELRLDVRLQSATQFELSFSSAAHHRYELQSSTNFSNWILEKEFTGTTNATVQFFQAPASPGGTRFYRVQEVPE